MKKTLSLLAVAALAVGTSLSAATTLKVYAPTNPETGYPETVSSVFGTTTAASATLISTDTEGIIYFDEREESDIGSAPFDLTHGTRVKNLVLSGTLPTSGDSLVIDFTSLYQANLGYYLQDGAMGYLQDDVQFEIEYLVVNFDDADFAEWYTSTPMTITGKFKDGVEATAYVISGTCDQADGDTTYGGLVFFNNSVAQQVRLAEIPAGGEPAVPEPTTATLSLLALAGLAARRRRK